MSFARLSTRPFAGRSPVGDARGEVEGAARSSQFEWLSRAGFVARGIVYGVIGVLAIQLALGEGGDATDQKGALQTIADGPLGKVLLFIVAVGLAGYALWRIVRAAIGHGPESGQDSALERAAGLVSGVFHGALAVVAVQLLAGSSSSSSGGGGADKATAGVFDWPAGPWLVGITGVIMIGVGLYQAREGATKRFLEKSKSEQMTPELKRPYTAMGVIGYLARAVVFALIGWFLVRAAIEHDPNEAIGLDGALAKLGQASYGPVLLGVVAAGLVAFAVYSVVESRYRKI